jgi:hypothetical protein
MSRGLGLAAILSTMHPYPGWMAANQAALRLSKRWLEWRRG